MVPMNPDDGPIGGGGGSTMPLPPVEPPPMPVSSCAEACARYVACDRAVEVFGTGGEGTCLQRCERATRNGDEAAADWWQCLSQDACNVINRCPLPPIEPLSCMEVCGLVSSCEVEINFTDCEATCNANAETFRPCGENLFGACDPAGFESCLSQEVYAGCGAYCEAAVGCNVIRADGCERGCINQYIEDDPLTIANFELSLIHI